MFSTFHTNDAVTASTRLLDMGVEPFLVSSAISGVLAQRLIRQLCKHCREEYTPGPGDLPVDFSVERGQKLHRAKGCRECRQTGYRGRLGIYELLPIDEQVRDMIVRRKSAGDLLVSARAKGFKLTRGDGWTKVLKGITTVKEIMRVTKVHVDALSK